MGMAAERGGRGCLVGLDGGGKAERFSLGRALGSSLLACKDVENRELGHRESPILFGSVGTNAHAFLLLICAQTLAPKIVMALIAALCDSSTYNLARRISGPSVAPTAVRRIPLPSPSSVFALF